jgi:hypothetical protein
MAEEKIFIFSAIGVNSAIKSGLLTGKNLARPEAATKNSKYEIRNSKQIQMTK